MRPRWTSWGGSWSGRWSSSISRSAPGSRVHALPAAGQRPGVRPRAGRGGRRRGCAADAVVDWVRQMAATVAAGVRGPEQAALVARTAAERATVDAALDRARQDDPVTALAIAADLGWAWVLLDDVAGAARLRAARTPEAPRALQARALLLESWIEAMSGDLAAARRALDAGRRSPATTRSSPLALARRVRAVPGGPVPRGARDLSRAGRGTRPAAARGEGGSALLAASPISAGATPWRDAPRARRRSAS